LQRKDYKLALEKERFIALTGSGEMLEALMYSGKKAPRNFVLRSLRAHALDVDDENDGVELPANPEVL
jgi:hypothetical protein